MTKMAIFANSRWRTAAILKIALSPYLSRELPYFDDVWYTDAHPSMEIWQNSKFFKLKMAAGRYIENRFLAISRRLIGRLTRDSEKRWRITCRYSSRDQKWKFFHIHDGGRPPFCKQFSMFTSFLLWINVIQCFSIGVLVSIKSWKQADALKWQKLNCL